MSPRILVTVSRTYTDISTMREVLEKAHAQQPEAVLVHGDAARADRLAAYLWRNLGGRVEAWPAAWGSACTEVCNHKPRKRKDGAEFCPVPGPARNARMVESNPDLVLAFIKNHSKGATGTYDLAVGAGLRCVEPYRQED